MGIESNRGGYWSRVRRSVSRRTLLRGTGVAVAGSAALALVGCSGGGDNNGAGGKQSSGTEEPVANRDGMWRSRQSTPMSTINPWFGTNGSTWGMSMPVYDHLFIVPTDTGEPENFLAESLEMPDQTHFTIKIKPAVWQNRAPVNGRAVTAEDVQATFLGIKTQPKLTKDAWWDNTLEKVDVIDDKTLTMTLRKPDAWTFMSNKLSSPWVAIILPKEHATNPGLMDNDLVGSGLYEFVSHENGTNLKVKRNETYRVKGLPNLAGIQTKLIQEPAAAMAAFSAKELDSYSPQNKLEKDQLLQKHGDQISIRTALSNAVFLFIARSDGQFADSRVLQALSMALDRKEMVDLITFGEGKICGPVPPNHEAYALTDKEIADTYGRFDAAEAKKLLGATGFDTSKEYSLKYYTGNDNYAQFVQILQAQLQKSLGIKTKIVGEDYGTWIAKSLYASNFELTAYPSIAYEDPSGYTDAFGFNYGPVPNFTGLHNQELQDALTKMTLTYDNKARQQQAKDVQKRAWQVGNPYIPTFVQMGYTAYQGWVKGTPDPKRGAWGFQVGSTWIEKH